jgi:hypothetical protein
MSRAALVVLLSTTAVVAALVGCVPTIWDKPGATQAEFNVDNARCRLLARGMSPGDFYAQGTPQFVAGASVGNAISTAAAQTANYKDCMMVLGYTPRGQGTAPEGPAPQAGSATILASPDEECRSLQALVEQRRQSGIVASDRTKEALQRCGLPYSGH